MILAVPVRVGVRVLLFVAVSVGDCVCEGVCVDVADALTPDVIFAVGVGEAVGVSVGVFDLVGVPVREREGVTVVVTDGGGDAPNGRVFVGVLDTVLVGVIVAEMVVLGV